MAIEKYTITVSRPDGVGVNQMKDFIKEAMRLNRHLAAPNDLEGGIKCHSIKRVKLELKGFKFWK